MKKMGLLAAAGPTVYNGVTFDVTGTSWKFVTFGVQCNCKMIGKVTRTENSNLFDHSVNEHGVLVYF